ncbi:permease-like cell division protein FtsX [Vibrio sp.]|uniref:permease-like cell division protein FtsX n=1 Tax=Vibrio sp. TaxID=678 RepID=UPI003D138ED7
MAANARVQKKSTQNRSKHKVKTDSFITVHIKQAKAAFTALWVRPLGNLLTLAVISMALAMPACLYLLGKNVAAVSQDFTQPAQVSGYLNEQVPEARVMVLKDQLESLPEVAQVVYISPQQGLDDLSRFSGFDQALSLLDDYSLPGVLVITPASSEQAKITALAQQMQQEQDISDVRLDEDWISRLDALRNLVTLVVAVLSALMLTAVFLIVGNTLRFNVQANKDEIQTMKLIGATDSFILRPYLYSGMWFGVLGSITAWVLTALITVLLNGSVAQLAQLYDSPFRLIGLNWDESLLLVMLGTLLGCLAARLSAKRHLDEIEPV